MEQFLYALFHDERYRLLKSPGVHQLLTDQNYEVLRTRDTASRDPLWLDTERVVAYQDIHPVNYGNGLTGIWNHTLLIPIREYIRLTNPFTAIQRFFFTHEDAVPDALATITL
jgi:hypothetical protein